MIKTMFILLSVFTGSGLLAQDIVTQAKIEFEVRCNIHKILGEGSWNDKMREALPQFSVKYFDFTFSGDKSVYKYTRTDDRVKIPGWIGNGDDKEETIWYSDYAKGIGTTQRSISGEKYLVADSLRKIDWRMTNESRVIAGFNCRKAVGKMFDSVYVFAFYTDDIMITGGPMSLNGLPGMILGVTIPRLNTSYIAIKVQVTGIDEKKIVAPQKGKASTNTSLDQLVSQRTKDWDRKSRDRFIWDALL